MTSGISIRCEPDWDIVLLCDAGYEPLRGSYRALREALRGSDVIAVTGPVLFTTQDAVHVSTWVPRAITISDALADPRGVPPVWAMRVGAEPTLCAAWDDPFAVADAWIATLRPAVGNVTVLAQPVARYPLIQPTRWELALQKSGYENALREFLERHAASLQSGLRDIIVGRELAGVALGDVYAEALRRRDEDAADIARLERLVAERAGLTRARTPGLDWGGFARTSPVSRDWGYSRGGPVDRRYIRDFVEAHSSDIRGRVLEVQENDLTREFGGLRVTESDVLDINRENPRATVFADLRRADRIADSRYDCIVLTQTAHVIDDMAAVVRECHRLLAPGGVLLATFPCLSRVCLEYGPNGDFWRLTPAGARSLVGARFDDLTVEAYGNVKTAVAFLHGLGERELTDADYAVVDPYNPLLVGVRARKRDAASAGRDIRGIILAYHRIEPAGDDRFNLTVPPAVFEQQLRWLEEHATIVALETLLSSPPEDLPSDAVALTFDDGYSQHLDLAGGLAARNVPATFFLTSAGLDEPLEYWWDLLERVDARDADRHALHDRLVCASLETRDTLVRELRMTARGSARRRPLSRDEARRLAALPGIAIGAHGEQHLCLPRQADAVKRSEMRESRRALEDATGVAVRTFAYPYGAVDRETTACARAEFHYALDSEAGPVRASFDAARVHRLDVKAWPPNGFAARVNALRDGPRPVAPVRLLP